ncbi:carboxymuconolactone decarboxylase family protein [Rhodococcus triatomae]|nr:carboxymuconolactone decarboxylase [Rhodococcus triatomae BKS 15-14]
MPADERRAVAPERRFGELTTAKMNTAQRSVNDWLVEYLYPDRAGTGAEIGGPMSALLHSPKLAEGIGRMVPLMFDGLSIPRKATELAILLTARHWNCHFEFDTHRKYAAQHGLDVTVVDAIANGIDPELSSDLAATYTFAVMLLRTGDVDDISFASISEQWGMQGAVELIGVVGFYSMLAMVLNVDRYPVPTADRLLPNLSDDHFQI